MMSEQGGSFYERFYSEGGWGYDLEGQEKFLRDRILEPLGVEPPAKIIDVGCGTGDQVAAFDALGYDAVGIDLSEAGIRQARDRYPGITFHCDDAQRLGDYYDPETFDLIFLRGMSWYHYELGDFTRRQTARLMRYLKPGGYVVLYIKTDFSGDVEPDDGVINNRLGAYVQLFDPLGTIELITDKYGRALHSPDDTQDATNIIIATRKVKEEHPEEAEQWEVTL